MTGVNFLKIASEINSTVECNWKINIKNYKSVRKSTAHKYVIHKRININGHMLH